VKNLKDPDIHKWRDRRGDALLGMKDEDMAYDGAFLVLRGRTFFRVLATSGMGWDHVSVSLSDRCPTWDEMEFIKRLFFKDDETVMQLHVPPKDHKCLHPYCLHLWKPHEATGSIPRPPNALVGADVESLV
jgi:hypothetical protein